MSFNTQTIQVSGKPIMVQKLGAAYVGQDTTALMSEATATLDTMSQPVYYILDLTDINLSFSDIVLSANLATRGDQPAFHHPNVIEMLVVTRDATLRMAALGLQHPVFGNAKMKVFDTYEDALAHTSQ